MDYRKDVCLHESVHVLLQNNDLAIGRDDDLVLRVQQRQIVGRLIRLIAADVCPRDRVVNHKTVLITLAIKGHKAIDGHEDMYFMASELSTAATTHHPLPNYASLSTRTRTRFDKYEKRISTMGTFFFSFSKRLIMRTTDLDSS